MLFIPVTEERILTTRKRLLLKAKEEVKSDSKIIHASVSFKVVFTL